MKNHNVLAFPKVPVSAPEKHSGKTVAHEQLMRAKAGKALANAKQRCTNKANKDYPNYGALGVKVIFKNAAELVASIGLPKPSQTLDRIDPNGHYGPDNVRWVTKAVQAANKKSNPGASSLPLAHLVMKYQSQPAHTFGRLQTTKAWCMMLRALNHGYLLDEHLEVLAGAKLARGILQASFDIDDERDWLDPPGTFHMPAISSPEERVRLRGGPFTQGDDRTALTRLGRLPFGPGDLDLNVPAAIKQSIGGLLHGEKPGLALVGHPSPADLRSGWIEGWSLVLASRLPKGTLHTGTAFKPLLIVLQDLNRLGPRANWDWDRHDTLDAQVLFIPDFQLDCGDWGQPPQDAWWKLHQLLTFRRDTGRRTVLGIQNAGKLTEPLKRLILGEYNVLEVGGLGAEHPEPALPNLSVLKSPFAQHNTMSQLQMAKHETFRRLLIPSAFIH